MEENKDQQVIYQTSGTFTLTNDISDYPVEGEGTMILRRGFNSVNVRGSIENASLQITHNGINSFSQIIPDLNNSGKINETVPFPFNDNSGHLKFKLIPFDPKKPISKADLTFSLENLPTNMYDKLSKKYQVKIN